MSLLNFNGQNTRIPGVYSRVNADVQLVPAVLDFGKVLVIDTGQAGDYAGGPGIAGELDSGSDAIKEAASLRDFRDLNHGGLWWFLGERMFNPYLAAGQGVSSIQWVRAAATTAASRTLTFTGGGSNGGSLTIKARNEGRAGNAILNETRAKADITFSGTSTGAAAVTFSVDSTEIAATSSLDVGTTAAQAATALSNAINATSGNHGYIAEYVGAVVYVYAPEGSGVFTDTVATTEGAGLSTSINDFSGGAAGTTFVKGYWMTVTAGTVNTSAYKISFYRGSWKGKQWAPGPSSTEYEYDQPVSSSLTGELLVATSELTTVGEFISWAAQSTEFNTHFKLTASSTAGDGSVDATDISNNSGQLGLSGGTQTYSSAHLTTALTALEESDASFIMLDSWINGTLNQLQSTYNSSIISWNSGTAKYKKLVGVALGSSSSEFSTSQTQAAAFDSDLVFGVHSGIKWPDEFNVDPKIFPSIAHLAIVTGRLAGLAPQVPITHKGISVLGMQHEIASSSNKEIALENGLLITTFDREFGRYTVLKGVNTRQLNDNVVYSDGGTPSIQLKRIALQLQKELQINMKRDLLSSEQGVNRNTLSPADVAAYTERYLTSRLASRTEDDLLVSFSGIAVTIPNSTTYNVTFNFQPNFEVDFITITATIVDPTN